MQIHAYKEAFLHTKSVSIDDQVAWIGTCNMDMRSFELNEEVVALFFDRRIAGQLAAIEDGYMRGSEPRHAGAVAAPAVRPGTGAEPEPAGEPLAVGSPVPGG